RHVAVVLAALVGGAEVDVGYPLRVDAGALDRGADHVGGEVVGADTGERAPIGAHRGTDRVDDKCLGHRGEPYPEGMGFVLGTIALLLALALILAYVAHVSQRRDVDLIDWKPTRSPEVEAQNEIDDVRQMVEAQNDMRRRRGAPELDEERLRAEV